MNALFYWLALSHLPGIGAVTARRGLAYFHTIEALFAAKEEDWRLAGFTAKQIDALKNPDWRQAEKDFHWLNKHNATLITLVDAAYPALLREIYDAPLVLYVQGEPSLLARPQLAIVGSRNPTVTGVKIAQQFAYELAQAGWIISSGLALGIDAASHRGALAAGGKTIAVLGAGLKQIYPRSHQALAEEIINQGALVTEFPPDTPPKAIHFPMRNRIISGFCAGVLVVEAAVRSGSLITARSALEQNREVFAIPGSIHNPMARGCHQLIRQGAKLVETTQDILEEVGWLVSSMPLAASSATKQEAVDLDPEHQRVLAQIGYELTALDVIIIRAGLTSSEVSSILLSLELEGYVRRVPAGYIRLY